MFRRLKSRLKEWRESRRIKSIEKAEEKQLLKALVEEEYRRERRKALTSKAREIAVEKAWRDVATPPRRVKKILKGKGKARRSSLLGGLKQVGEVLGSPGVQGAARRLRDFSETIAFGSPLSEPKSTRRKGKGKRKKKKSKKRKGSRGTRLGVEDWL